MRSAMLALGILALTTTATLALEPAAAGPCHWGAIGDAWVVLTHPTEYGYAIRYGGNITTYGQALVPFARCVVGV